MTDLVTSKTNLLAPDFIDQLKASPKYVELISNINAALAESKEVSVFTLNDVSTASQYLKKLKNISAEAEAARKLTVQPLIDRKEEVDSFFKDIPLLVAGEIDRLSKELMAYKKREDGEARAKAAEKRKRLEEEALNNAIEAGVNEPAVVPEIIPQETKLSAMNTVNVQSRKTKEYEIVDVNKIPREYLMVDEKKIKAERSKYPAVNQDGSEVVSTIAGVRFTYTEKVV